MLREPTVVSARVEADLGELLVAARVRYHATHACCGAILSDYQRVRFENACTVAKLVPLAPMWQRSQRRLLKEMVRDGLDAAVVKVAALGLDPTKHLGKTIAQLAPHLDRLEREYGVHSCGEGGEYETIVLAFPALFREARLHVTKARATPPHAAGDGVVGAWVVDAFEVIGASTEAGEACAVSQVNDHDDDDAMQPPPAATVNGKDAAEMRADVRVGTWRSKHSLHICATAPMRGDDDDDAVQAALDAASKAARSAGVADGLGSAHYVTFCVPRMSRFADVNKHYAGHMPACDPPARCCLEMAGGAASCAVEVSFPAPLSKLAQMLAAKAPPGSVRPARDVMHVQSISPWAPSCIGPYAQMNRALGFRHYAGVIALDPWSMELVHVPSGNIEEQASLEARRVFASLHALYRRHGRDVLRDTFAAVAYTSGASADDAPNRVMQALDLVQDGLVHGAVDTRFVDALRSHAGLARPWDSDDDDDDDDDYDNGMEEEGEEEVRPYAKSLSKSHPPSLMLVADVGALPRGARFELIVNALDESWEGGDDDDDDDDDDDGDGAINVDSRRRARYMVAEDSFAGAFVRLRGGSAAACTTYAWCTPEEIASVGWSACASAAMQRALSRLPWRGLTSSDATHIRVYATVEVGSTEECDIREGLGDRANALIVACRALGTRVRGLKKSIGLAVEMHAIVM